MNFNWQFVVSKLFSIFFWCFQCFQPGSLSQATTFSTSPEMMGMSLKQTGDDQWMIERVEHIQFHFLNLWFGYSFWCIFFSTSDFFTPQLTLGGLWLPLRESRQRLGTEKKHMVFIPCDPTWLGTPPRWKYKSRSFSMGEIIELNGGFFARLPRVMTWAITHHWLVVWLPFLLSH